MLGSSAGASESPPVAGNWSGGKMAARLGWLTSIVKACQEERALFAMLTFALDAVLTHIIMSKVKYTEIDWKAYMEEVEGVENGEYDYANLKGGTGPLVYPGGFVWIFMMFKWLTDDGRNIQTAQMIFYAIYMCTQALVLATYVRAKQVPAWSLLLLLISKRMHSVYVLRLFNDCVAMLFAYASIYLFTHRKWAVGCVLYSLGVSVKMNVLLFAPGLLYILISAHGVKGAIAHIVLCATVQLVVGFPFLAYHPWSYIAGSFNLGRVFMHRWSVNLKFLPEEVFTSRWLAMLLLLAHASFLVIFYLRHLGHNRSWLSRRGGRNASPEFICKVLIVSNFVGIAFCRTMHYQFYSWYFHAIPGLLWATPLNLGTRLGLVSAIETAFTVTNPRGCEKSPPGPDCGSPVPAGSMMLTGAHAIVLLALLFAPQWKPEGMVEEGKKGTEKKKGK